MELNMEFLSEMIQIGNTVQIKNSLDKLNENFILLKRLYKSVLNEGFIDSHNGELERKFDQIEDKIIFLRRQLSTINMNNPEYSDELKSEIFRKLNSLRRELIEIANKLGMKDKEIDYHLKRIGLDVEYGKPSEFAKTLPSEQRKSNRVNPQIRKVVNYDRNILTTRPKINDNKPKMVNNKKRFLSSLRNFFSK